MNWIIVLGAIGLASLAGAMFVAVRKNPEPPKPVKPLPLSRVQFPPYWHAPEGRHAKMAQWPAPKTEDENHGEC